MKFHKRMSAQTETKRNEGCRHVIFVLIMTGLLLPLLMVNLANAAASLFDQIGIGSDWGPHWSSGPGASNEDVRDTQDDGAFPAEVCLVANAGFVTIRMYDENVETWMAVLDAVSDYNTGKLNCNPAAGAAKACGSATKPCMSVVYQAGICGPDPSSLTWNGLYTDIDSVTCYVPPDTEAGSGSVKFAESVRRETEKLKLILQYDGNKFAQLVPLVIIGNEILYSRGTCSNNGKACTQNDDCKGGTCNIGHFCSGNLSAAAMPAQCSHSSSCKSGTCTDVTNFKPIAYAFDQIQATLKTSLPAASKQPKLSISLQADVLSSPSFGDDWKTAPLMFSRQQVKSKLASVGNVLSVNVYPDQWGMVTTQGAGPPFPSCINEKNAVQGAPASLPAACAAPQTRARYLDSRNNLIAHSISDYFNLFNNRYYKGMDILVAETGWHTAGTCAGYNDSKSVYSPEQAAAYYSSLYAYAQKNKVPLLVFELFDQKTKTCTTTSNSPAEANYGIFNNYCEIKGDETLYQSFLPKTGPGSPGANLEEFDALLDPDPRGGKSCRNQTLIKIIGTGDTGVCYHNPQIACQSGYYGSAGDFVCPAGPAGSDNACMWGVCANGVPKRGCNPDDPANGLDGCKCMRAGECANKAPDAGTYTAYRVISGHKTNAACWQDSTCNDAIAPFVSKTCGNTNSCACFAEMAPSTVSRTITGNLTVEGPGFNLAYKSFAGNFAFKKTRTLGLKIQSYAEDSTAPSGFDPVWGPVWGNIFMGEGWKLQVVAPTGSQVNGKLCPENTIKDLLPGGPLTYEVDWDDAWSNCKYVLPVSNALDRGATVQFPRGFLKPVPSWPPK
jgi:hypothetical protein